MWRMLRLAVVIVVWASAFAGCGEDIFCPGTPGEHWVEGQIVVHFSDEIESVDAAEEFVESLGLSIVDYYGTDPVHAIVATPKGEECIWASRLDRKKEVDYAMLQYIFWIHCPGN